MSRNSSSEAQISTSDCSAQTDGASKMTSAHKNMFFLEINNHCLPQGLLLPNVTKIQLFGRDLFDSKTKQTNRDKT